MNTYLVRTNHDQTLMGIFCAETPAALADLIDSVFSSEDCEYLQMKANEGLFIEAKFVIQSNGPGQKDQVLLAHADDPAAFESAFTASPSEDELLSLETSPDVNEEALQDAERLMLAVDGDYIPPVLEPTQALNARIQTAHATNEWRSLSRRPVVATTRTVKPINPDAIATKLMEGVLNPANFMRNASTRHH